MPKEPVDQTRSLRFEMSYGSTRAWQLPAISNGGMATIIVKATTAGPILPRGRFDNLETLTETTLARATQPTGPVLDSTGATRELRVELLKFDAPVASTDNSPNPGFISYPTGPNGAGDMWALRVTRIEQGEPRRYRIEVQYPSGFVTEERTIPLGFFKRGFERNWEVNPLFKSIKVKDQKVTYQWRADYAAISEKSSEPIDKDLFEAQLGQRVRLPEINSIKVSIESGAAPLEGETIKRPYFELTIKGHYAGSKAITFDPTIQFVVDAHTVPPDLITGVDSQWFDLPNDPDDPSAISVKVRFHLHENAGGLHYFATVKSPLLDAIPAAILVPRLELETLGAPGLNNDTVHLRAMVIDRIQDFINDVTKQVAFDSHVRPFLIGRSEHALPPVPEDQEVLRRRHDILGLTYNAAKDEMVIRYANRRRPPLHPLDLSGPLPELTVVDAEPTLVPEGRPGRLPTGPLPTAVATATLLGVRHLPDLTHLPTLEYQRYPSMFDTRGEEPFPPRPQVPQLPDTSAGALSKIEHIVVLMQENRSFDQVLGYLSREGVLTRRGRIRQDGVNGLLPDDQRDWNQHGVNIYLSKNVDNAGVPVSTSWPAGLDGPCHGHDCVVRQVAGDMKGFVDDNAYGHEDRTQAQLQLVMNYYTEAQLPAYGALTREFAICDHWFCSFLGGTLPNRFVSLTGGLNLDDDGNAELKNPGLGDGTFAPLETDTFFDHLTRQKISWKLFEHGYSTLRLFRNYTFDETNIVGFGDPDHGFARAARTPGALPQVSFIEPDYIELPGADNDDHAPADMFNGQRLVASIMDALLESPPGVWEKTLFIITYDEHGGFYDHVSPPTEIESTATDGTVTRTPIPPLAPDIVLGLRVPAFVISPLIPPMTEAKVNVAKTVFDHTTIPATILRRFCSPQPPYMGPRMAAAADVGHLLTLETARPRSDFADLKNLMKDIAAQPQRPSGTPTKPAAVRLESLDDREDFRGLIGLVSSITGLGR